MWGKGGSARRSAHLRVHGCPFCRQHRRAARASTAAPASALRLRGVRAGGMALVLLVLCTAGWRGGRLSRGRGGRARLALFWRRARQRRQRRRAHVGGRRRLRLRCRRSCCCGCCAILRVDLVARWWRRSSSPLARRDQLLGLRLSSATQCAHPDLQRHGRRALSEPVLDDFVGRGAEGKLAVQRGRRGAAREAAALATDHLRVAQAIVAGDLCVR